MSEDNFRRIVEEEKDLYPILDVLLRSNSVTNIWRYVDFRLRSSNTFWTGNLGLVDFRSQREAREYFEVDFETDPLCSLVKKRIFEVCSKPGATLLRKGFLELLEGYSDTCSLLLDKFRRLKQEEVPYTVVYYPKIEKLEVEFGK